MGDGWENRRRREPARLGGAELGAFVRITGPASTRSLQGQLPRPLLDPSLARAHGSAGRSRNSEGGRCSAGVKLSADKVHVFRRRAGRRWVPVKFVRLNIDGTAVSRLRVVGNARNLILIVLPARLAARGPQGCMNTSAVAKSSPRLFTRACDRRASRCPSVSTEMSKRLGDPPGFGAAASFLRHGLRPR